MFFGRRSLVGPGLVMFGPGGVGQTCTHSDSNVFFQNSLSIDFLLVAISSDKGDFSLLSSPQTGLIGNKLNVVGENDFQRGFATRFFLFELFQHCQKFCLEWDLLKRKHTDLLFRLSSEACRRILASLAWNLF